MADAPRLRRPFPILAVAEMAHSRAFYEAAGGSLSFRFPPDGDEIAYAVFAFAGGEIAVSAAGGGPPPGEREGYEICCYTDDASVMVERLTAAGGSLEKAPELMPWGEIMAYVRDPDGHRLHIAQELPAKE
jgi:uncharacterized glyoxalase superfamily protein PhnB